MQLHFKCRVCGRTDLPPNRVPEGFQDSMFGNSISLFDPVQNATWPAMEQLPQIDEKRCLMISYPVSLETGQLFWFLYRPGLSFFNGWDEHPEELDKSAVIQCRFEKILNQDEFSALISVVITEIRMLPDLYKYYPEQVKPDLFEKYEPSDIRPSSCAYQNWFYDQWNIQGDLGEWKLFFTDDSGKQRLILMGKWDFHQDIIYIGNIIKS